MHIPLDHYGKKWTLWSNMNVEWWWIKYTFFSMFSFWKLICNAWLSENHEIYRKDFYFPFFIQKKTLQTLFIANNIWKQFKLTISILDFSPSCFFSIIISATDIKWIFSFFFLFGMHFFQTEQILTTLGTNPIYVRHTISKIF